MDFSDWAATPTALLLLVLTVLIWWQLDFGIAWTIRVFRRWKDRTR